MLQLINQNEFMHFLLKLVCTYLLGSRLESVADWCEWPHTIQLYIWPIVYTLIQSLTKWHTTNMWQLCMCHKVVWPINQPVWSQSNWQCWYNTQTLPCHHQSDTIINNNQPKLIAWVQQNYGPGGMVGSEMSAPPGGTVGSDMSAPPGGYRWEWDVSTTWWVQLAVRCQHHLVGTVGRDVSTTWWVQLAVKCQHHLVGTELYSRRCNQHFTGPLKLTPLITVVYGSVSSAGLAIMITESSQFSPSAVSVLYQAFMITDSSLFSLL